MNRIARYIAFCLLLCASVASAQQATIIELSDGKYFGIAYTPSGEQVVLTNITIVKVNPTPTPPVKAGKRDIAIVYESAQVGERQASLHVQLQTNQAQLEWRRAKGHRLFILDKDAKDKTGQVSAVVQRFTKVLPASQRLPALVILDQSSDGVLFVGDVCDVNGNLLPTMTLDGITELIKKHGG